MPLGKVILFMLLNSIFILLGRYKLGLLISYCLVLYWGYIFNSALFMDMLGQSTIGLPVYVFSGIMMVVLVIIGSFMESRD